MVKNFIFKFLGNESLWIVIPVFNESESIGIVLEELFGYLGILQLNTRVLVVNDSSVDDTKKVLDGLLGEFQNLEVIEHHQQLGKTEAIKSGFSIFLKGSDRFCITMDGDGQDDPIYIPKILKELAIYPVVNGSRIKRGDRALKLLGSYLFNLAWRSVYRLPKDINSGFKGFHRTAVHSLMPTLSDDSFRLSLPALHRMNFGIGSIEIIGRERKYGKSKFQVRGKVIKAILTFIRYIFSSNQQLNYTSRQEI